MLNIILSREKIQKAMTQIKLLKRWYGNDDEQIKNAKQIGSLSLSENDKPQNVAAGRKNTKNLLLLLIFWQQRLAKFAMVF